MRSRISPLCAAAYVLIVGACGGACTPKGSLPGCVGPYMDVTPSEAERDARRALASGDDRLWAVDGFAREIPGLPRTTVQSSYGHRMRVIPRTSDNISCHGELKFNADARRYAEIYNRTVLKQPSEK